MPSRSMDDSGKREKKGGGGGGEEGHIIRKLDPYRCESDGKYEK